MVAVCPRQLALFLSKRFASPQAAEVVEVEEEAEEEEEEECTPTSRVATFAAGDSPLEAGLEYFRHALQRLEL